MKKLSIVNHYSDNELENIIKKTKDAKLAIKLNAIYIMQTQELSCNKASSKLPHSHDTLRRWVHIYNEQGIEGLIDKRKNNKRQNHLYTKEFLERVKELLLIECPYGGIWTGKKLIRWIKDNYGVVLGLTTVYRLAHKLGYSWKVPRPKHKGSKKKNRKSLKKNISRISI